MEIKDVHVPMFGSFLIAIGHASLTLPDHLYTGAYRLKIM